MENREELLVPYPPPRVCINPFFLQCVQKLIFLVLLYNSISAGSHILYPVSDSATTLNIVPPLTRFLPLDRTEPVVDDFLLLIFFLCRLRRGHSRFV